ncbi:hypothetical protein BIY26_09015 [Brenneria goodwinii]|uniref:Uncharacterized protein n=1 Tax=Brenneria goodwinii TaxID=1109412 RepID=A0AAE8EPR2_9GAMM|nr:hypothetical protein [Brenneria goodwinii]ATA26601.1 hypothetical protein AWC36_22230 [Brenneria goodwinii]RLM25399.1 hypothetical protein BIY26_09015 [Brenneria goodwinii]
MSVKKIFSSKWFWAACSALVIAVAVSGIIMYGLAGGLITTLCFIGSIILFDHRGHPALLPDKEPFIFMYQIALGVIGCGTFCAAWLLCLAYVGVEYGSLFFLVAGFTCLVLHRTATVWGVPWIR